MNTIRTSIALCAVDIVVTIGSRAWYVSSLGYGEEAFYGGVLLGGLLWVLGTYHGYHAIRAERRR